MKLNSVHSIKRQIKRIAKIHNINIIELELTEKQPDGCIVGNTIGIKKHLYPGYWNYVVLHEIGHYFLHMNKKNIWNLSIIKDQKEKEADAFACKKILTLAGGCGDIRTILR